MRIETTPWRELFRSDDLALARSVLVSIASMEFEVRLRGIGRTHRPTVRAVGEARAAEDEAQEFAPFIIEVHEGDWSDLIDVLDQIVDEQAAFDRDLERRQRERMFIAAIIMLGVVAAGGLAWSIDRAPN